MKAIATAQSLSSTYTLRNLQRIVDFGRECDPVETDDVDYDGVELTGSAFEYCTGQALEHAHEMRFALDATQHALDSGTLDDVARMLEDARRHEAQCAKNLRLALQELPGEQDIYQLDCVQAECEHIAGRSINILADVEANVLEADLPWA